MHEQAAMIRERRVWLPVLLLVVLGFALYLPRLSASGLWDPWEPKYAQTARETARESSWVIPQFRDDERLNKAPMTYWLIALPQAVLGVNEVAARLPSALLAVLAAAALGFAFAARGRPLEGFLAGAALLTMPQWVLTGRFATPDMPHAAFLGIALALVLWSTSADCRRRSRLGALLLLCFVAAAGLTDWPRGLLLPLWAVLGWGALRWSWKGPLALAAVAGLYHTAQMTYSVPLNLAAIGLAVVLAAVVLRLRAGVSLPVILAGAAIVVLLVAPWFVAAYTLEPDELKTSIFRYKYAFNLGESEKDFTGPYHYIVRTAAIGGMPWSAAALVGLIAVFGRRRDEAAGVLAGALLGGVLFFTLSEAQMGHFYTVLQPAIAGLAAIGTVAVVRRLDWRVAPVVAALVALWFVILDKPTRILETATVKTNLFTVEISGVVAAVILAWALGLAAAKISGSESWATVSVVPAALLAGYLGMYVVPELDSMKSMRTNWESYVDAREGDEPIALYGPIKDGAFYYSDNAIERLKGFDEVQQFMSGSGVKFLLVRTSFAARPTEKIAGSWESVDRSHPTHHLLRFEPTETAAE